MNFEVITETPKINEEFKNLIPPLTPEEFNLLETSLIDEGCRDALITWQGFLIDGHNRLEICTRHGIPFTTKEMQFEDKAEAMAWMAKNQLGRRNLNNFQRAELALIYKPIIEKQAKENQLRTSENRVRQISDKQEVDTKKVLAEIAGVSHDTTSRVEKIKTLADDETIQKLRQGNISINEAYKQVRTIEKKQEWEQKQEQAKQELAKLEPSELEVQSNVFNMDCLEGIKTYPDGYFDLAIIDPPYSIGADKKNSTGIKQTNASATESNFYGNKDWDSEVPTKEFFQELFRVSKRQIIWGVNYYPYEDMFTGGRLFWDKGVTMPTYSKGELAYLSFQNKVDYVQITWHGMIQHDMKNKEERIHPTQKPIALYEWLLDTYAKQGDKILDTHMGSQTSRIASYNKGYDYWGYEIDEQYFNLGCLKFEKEIRK